MLKKTGRALMTVLFLASCSSSETTVIKDEYLYCSTECFSDNGLFYIGMDGQGGLHFTDPGNFRNYDLSYHQMKDDETMNPVYIGFVCFYDGRVVYSKLEDNSTSLVIYECSPDGTEESRITVYSANGKGQYEAVREAFLYHDSLYFSRVFVNFGNSAMEEVLCSLNLKTGKTEELTAQVKSNGSSLIPAFIYDDCLYFNSEVNLETNEFSDAFILYRYCFGTGRTEEMNDQLVYPLHLKDMPESEYVYFGTGNAVSEDDQLLFMQYDLKTNEITEQIFEYDLDEGDVMYSGTSFSDFIQIRIMKKDSEYPDTVFYYPQTGIAEYFEADDAFIPSLMNSSYILGYEKTDAEGYMFSMIGKDDFEERNFSKAVRISK